MKNIVQPNLKVLKWARTSAGYTVQEVADKLRKIYKKITEQTIIDFENGTAFPTYSQLETLAYKIYRRPLAIFFFPKPPDENHIKKSFRTLPKPIEKLEPEMRFLLRKAHVMQLNLMELYENENKNIEKKIFEDIKFNPNSSIKNLSKKVREYLSIKLIEQKKWKDSKKALNQWRKAVQSSGVFVFKDSFKNSKFSGFCLYDKNFPVIYINSKQTDSRQIFTLFHELAHILFHTSGFDPLDENHFRGQLKGSNKKIEGMCNEFAGVFLVPDEFLSQNIHNDFNINMTKIDQWAKECSVSPEVILIRIRKKQLISQKKYNSLLNTIQGRYEKFSKKKPKSHVPYTVVKESHLGKKYISLVYSKYYKNQISVEQLTDFLGEKKN